MKLLIEPSRQSSLRTDAQVYRDHEECLKSIDQCHVTVKPGILDEARQALSEGNRSQLRTILADINSPRYANASNKTRYRVRRICEKGI